MTYPYKYAQQGPPFNFLGNLCLTQKKAFYAWLDRNTPKQEAVAQWYQIRSNQLRKSAGLLEQFYAKKYDFPLKPTFQKKAWQPGPDGHFSYVVQSDIKPAVRVAEIKARFQEMLQRDDEAMFWMNWLRNHIERHEDKATLHEETPDAMVDMRKELDAMFSNPAYAAVLVDDTVQYRGTKGTAAPGPHFRVAQLDEPTLWEKEQFSHNSDGTVGLKAPAG